MKPWGTRRRNVTSALHVALFLLLVVDDVSSFVLRPQVTRFPAASPTTTTTTTTTTTLFGKKAKRKGAAGKNNKRQQQPQQEKQSVKDARFDAQTRQFMFSIVGLSKVLPDKSKTILKNINLAFYPGAKIGIVGSNGSGT